MESGSVDLKKTVNLPSTGFGMRANLPTLEPKLLAEWNATKLYHRIREARAESPRYVLHDGPPYANGNIHLGHAFNKLLKDFIIKWKTMAGYDSPYVPGWDCHGLPIEIKVDSQLGSKKAAMSAAEIRGECRKYAEKYVHLQSESFQRLGVFGRWEDPYLTMSAGYEAVIAGAFVDFLSKGSVYKGLKPVNWCLHCRTALAEAEVEYGDHKSPSIWVRFALTSDAAAIDSRLEGRKVYGLIWTTTPWTIPANVGIAFHPNYEYVAVEVDGDVYIVAAGLLTATMTNCGWPGEPQVVARFNGSKLEGATFRHPFLERESKGVLADYVTLEQGTGAVHTAPGHGADDYLTGQRYGLPTFCPVDAHGRLYRAEGAPGYLPDELIGKSVWEANPVVIDILTQRGALMGQKEISHSYPHCWRCHKPTIFRATEQWFIGMEANDLRQKALEAIKTVSWHPAWGEERISNMIATRPDWCISRQRVWGVPITVFYCEKCGEALTDRKYLDPIVEMFKTQTADAWYRHTAAELLPPDVKCPKCGASEFRKENDILDVWFDSGASHLAVMEPNGMGWPADMYLEGGDQYRGWFHSSLLIGVGLRGASPYRECATAGWTLDGEGRPMSKSLGNVISPETIIKKYGADVLRLWVSSVAFHEDVRMSELILTRLTEAYRKLRNTLRYTLGNLADFDPEKDAVPAADLPEIDRWILYRAAALVETCRANYEEISFHRVYQAIYNFATTDLSSVYFDVLKDRLYTSAPNSRARRSAQTALYRVQHALIRLAAPLLAFTCEEAWGHSRRRAADPDSVHLALAPTPEELTEGLAQDHAELSANWDRLMEVRATVLKSLEEARNAKLIGAPLEACVVLTAGPDLYPLLKAYQAELPALFITSEVKLTAGDTFAATVEKASGVKCERCWKYTHDVGVDAALPTVCGPCAEAVHAVLGD